MKGLKLVQTEPTSPFDALWRAFPQLKNATCVGRLATASMAKEWRRNAMSTSAQDEQHERRRVFAQDQSLHNQGTTFHQHAQADAETPRGRFSAVSAAHVVGSTATPQYPQASAPFQFDPVPDEPPLSFDNP